MSKKPTDPLDQPTRRTVEKLLQEMDGYYRASHDPEVDYLNSLIEALLDKFKESAEYKALDHKRVQAYNKAKAFGNARSAAVSKVRRAYQAKGLTPAVRKMLSDLVDKYGSRG